jgi:ADP-heptose:LPS heptosyltransferase
VGAGALDLAGRTPDLRLLCGVIDRAALVVGIDSGPLHVAATLGAPVVAIFPLKNDCPARWRFFGPVARVVGTADWTCPLRCVKETCGHFACLSHLDVAAALSAARDRLPLGLARLDGSALPASPDNARREMTA